MFLFRLSIGLLALLMTHSYTVKASQSIADTVILNGKVHTLKLQPELATALAIKGSNFIAVGTNEQIGGYIGPNTQVVDLKGASVLPGFIDTHAHIFEGASEVGGSCELSSELNLYQQRNLLQECAEQVRRKGDWVIGYGHQLDALFDGVEHTTPKAFLDDIFPDNPLIIMEESSHSMLVNSAALVLADISRHTPAPQGGSIMLSEVDGEPNGVLFDNAGDRVMELAWNSSKNNVSKSYQGLLAGLDLMTQNGITTVGDGRMYWRRGWYKVWMKALEQQALTSRVSVRPWIYPEVDVEPQLKFLKMAYRGNKNSPLLIEQVKMYIDGVLHFGTAKVAKPYHWNWQQDTDTGLYYIEPGKLTQWLIDLDKIGYGAHIHAVGDQGIHQAINSIGLIRKQGSQRQYSLTHLEMLQTRDIPRFAALNIDADFQAGAHFFAQHDWAIDYIGKNRASTLLPMREVHNTGANVTFSSDWTVNSLNPLVAIANSLRHKFGQGLPDINQAIKAATINGAKALGLEKITGSIQVGKSADFVVLSRDITQLKPDEIEQTQVLMTWFMGEKVFSQDE